MGMTLQTFSQTPMTNRWTEPDLVNCAEQRGYERALCEVARNMRKYGLGWVNIAIATGLEVSQLKKIVEHS